MLEKLGNAIKKATDRISNAIFLDKSLVDEIVRELQRSLIEADVNILLVKQLSEKLRKIAFDEKIKGIEKKEHLIKALHDELVSILGEKKDLILKEKQNKIVLLGLYAAGKTTTIAKLANYYQKRGKKVAILGLDVHRPAAKEQLLQLGKENNLTIFVDKEETNALKTWKKIKPKLEKYEIILIDTAGRHDLDKELVKEIKDLTKEIKPQEKILVIQADIGQAAKKQAQEFKEAVNVTGVIITRMDSTAKGGGALSACSETKAPVYFITNGEKINDLEEFNPKNFLSRLLGMGDLNALIEKVRSITGEDKQAEIQKKIQEGELSLEDVVEQVKSMNKLGGFSKLKAMIPGMEKAKISEEKLGAQEQKIKRWEHILNSMTQEEKKQPTIILKQTKRISRIAKGAGVNTSDVRSLLKQYELLQSMIKDSTKNNFSEGMDQKQMQKMIKKLGKIKKIKF